MKFQNLEDAERAHADLLKGMNTMLATQTGITSVLGAHVSTHPNLPAFLHFLMACEEISDVQFGAAALDIRQRETARTYVETFRQIAAKRQQTRPPAG